MWLSPSEAANSGYTPLSCDGLESGRLTCTAGNANYLQQCGNFVGLSNGANSQCQDPIAFDVQLTCVL